MKKLSPLKNKRKKKRMQIKLANYDLLQEFKTNLSLLNKIINSSAAIPLHINKIEQIFLNQLNRN